MGAEKARSRILIAAFNACVHNSMFRDPIAGLAPLSRWREKRFKYPIVTVDQKLPSGRFKRRAATVNIDEDIQHAEGFG
jgi:hypothetical protein